MTENGEGFRRTTDLEIKNIKKSIDVMVSKMDSFIEQRVKVNQLQDSTNTLWKEYRTLTSADGILHQLRSFQESCPRQDLRSFMKKMESVIDNLGKTKLDKEELEKESRERVKEQKKQWKIIALLALLHITITGAFIVVIAS